MNELALKSGTIVESSAEEAFLKVKELLETMHDILTRNYLNDAIVPKSTQEIIQERRLRLIRIKCIRYRKPENILKAMTSLITTTYHLQVPMVYILFSSSQGIELYLGLYCVTNSEDPLEDAFQSLLVALPGFLPGSEIIRIKEEKRKLFGMISNLQHRRIITGIPSYQEIHKNQSNAENVVQGIEQLADSIPENFALITYAQPLTGSSIRQIIENVSEWHDLVHQYVKVAEQLSSSFQTGGSISQGKTVGEQTNRSTGSVTGETNTTQPEMLRRWKQGFQTFRKGGERPLKQRSSQVSEQESSGTSFTDSTTINWQYGQTDSRAVTLEHTNQQAHYIEELLGRLHKRLDAGIGLGMWRTVTEIFSDKSPHADQAANVLAGTLSGESGSLDSIRIIDAHAYTNPFDALDITLLPDHPLGRDYGGISTLLTSSELSLITKLPTYELPGIMVEKLTEYGRTLPIPDIHADIDLGVLIDREKITARHVGISTIQLQRHCFVSGATGSGKSNTMRHLVTNLWQRNPPIPFLVIEPVKREYRMLKDRLGDDLRVFTLGGGNTDFSLNPFDFEPETGLVPHIDLLKAAFNASLGMYSSMPFILEDMIYRVYQLHGWDLETGKNPLLERSAKTLGIEPTEGLRDMFLPCLGDMIPLVEESINKFFPAITDYGGSLMGALRARLSSMTRGSKGNLLNRRQSISFSDLLSRPCVLELWPFTDNDEKAFVMALLLMRLYEFRQSFEIKSQKISTDGLKHVLVIEEAHRLLSKPSPSGEHSGQSRQKGVEVFADILAEIRSYGQSIIIVDQIPSKLIPDVLRNTDVKITHRLVDKEDRQILGATMNLDEEQLQDLARTEPGHASIYFSGLRKPLRIQVTESKLPETTSICSESDMGAYRKITAFGGLDRTSPEKIALNRPDLALSIIVGYLSISLCSGSEFLMSIRDHAIQSIQKLLSLDGSKCIWPALVTGFHQIPQCLSMQGLQHNMATYLTCVFASVMNKWLMNEPIESSLAKLKGENIGLGLLSVAENQQPSDILDLLIGIRLMAIRTTFQQEIEHALLTMRETRKFDFLIDTLLRHSMALVMSYNVSPKARYYLILRHLLQFQTDNPDLQQLGGEAFGILSNSFGVITHS
jgi:hypothetical protein